jgi:hypothetical protein
MIGQGFTIMTERDIFYMMFIGNCFIFSVMSFIFSVVIYIKYQAKEESTHTIEFRNPEYTYEDELDLNTKPNATVEEPPREYYENQEHIDKLNKAIEEDKVII